MQVLTSCPPLSLLRLSSPPLSSSCVSSASLPLFLCFICKPGADLLDPASPLHYPDPPVCFYFCSHLLPGRALQSSQPAASPLRHLPSIASHLSHVPYSCPVVTWRIPGACPVCNPCVSNTNCKQTQRLTPAGVSPRLQSLAI